MKDSKGKFLLVCQLFYPEMVSTGIHMTELAVALGRLGWSIDVVCAQPAALHEGGNLTAPAQMAYEGINIRRVRPLGRHRGSVIGRLTYGLTFMVSAGAFALWKAKNYDGLVLGTNPPFLGLMGLAVKWLRRKPFVVIVYDVYPETAIQSGVLRAASPVALAWGLASRWIAKGAKANVVIGRDMAEVIARKLGSQRAGLHLVNNWSCENTVSPVPKSQNGFRKLHNPGGAFLVQYSGTIGRTHNVECLIEAAALLRHENVLFQFVGDGFKKSLLQDTARQRGLTNVQFLPHQPLSDLAQVLSAADLAVVALAPAFTGLSVPSKTYGVMAAGVPVLALMDSDSEIGIAVIEAACGVVLPNASASEVAQVILSLRNDVPRIHEMGENGYRAFRARYTLAVASKRYDELLTTAFVNS